MVKEEYEILKSKFLKAIARVPDGNSLVADLNRYHPSFGRD